VFLPRFRLAFDQRPFISNLGDCLAVGGLSFSIDGLFVTDAEGLVGLGEVAVGGVVVGVGLGAVVDVFGSQFGEFLTEHIVVGPAFEFDFVHTRPCHCIPKAPVGWPPRTVLLKGASPVCRSMSDEQAEAEAAEAAESADAESETEQDGFHRGDFVKLDYTLRTTDDDDVVDTTILEVAEEAGIDTEQHEFSPRTIIIGEGHVFESVDDALVGSEVGDEDAVVISPEEAFGEYDPDQVRTVSADKIDEDDRYPGANVQIGNEQGHIETIIGGRARVNFNHPLAGEELEYEFEVLEEVEDDEGKAEGMLGMYLQHAPPLWIETDEVEEQVPVEPDEDDEDAEPEFETEVVEKETLYIESTPQLTMNQQWMMAKGQIAQDVISKTGVDRLVVQEVLDGSGGGMFGGMGGLGGAGDVEEALDDVDLDDVELDADELAEEIEDEA